MKLLGKASSRSWSAWQQWKDDRAVARRPISDAWWRRTLKRFPFLPAQGRDAQDLRRLCSLFLDRKEFTGAHGLIIRDDMALAIAAQACLPILRLGLGVYDSFVGIVVHPGQARAQRQFVDEDGVVHEFEEVISGEAVEGGPITLSWPDVRGAGATAAEGYNVVIHEFAHVLDMTNGRLDAMPALPQIMDARLWSVTWEEAFRTFKPQSEGKASSALDPYAGQSLEEFFAVMVEAFFVAPHVVLENHSALYGLLRQYFQRDPVQTLPPC